MSAAVVGTPTLKRIALSTRSVDNPIAVSTCDGSLEPLAQADPLEQ